jgi:CRP/FNR family transcriptional regulator, cyclic AMP receptor protein
MPNHGSPSGQLLFNLVLKLIDDTLCNFSLKWNERGGNMKRKANKNDSLGVQHYLGAVGKLGKFPKKRTIFTQGDSGDSVFYLKGGVVKLSLTNETGKEALIELLAADDFLGEGCISNGSSMRMARATTIAPTTAMEIKKDEMIRVLHEEKEFADRFISYMLKRNVRMKPTLVDQLFNSTEKRLARALLLLARYGKEGQPEPIVGKISQETLAELVGTTRSRVNVFMNKFRELGFIHYNGGLQVHSSLLNVVLHD